ncbi:hypothetical protein F5X68DRAFT_277689 [Plectosphaerella plurivora]|uniref:Uncharacterized protein n=1 Tax=Plectosphaerella plurivora TaxID=936078 RepID=A0A9P9A7S8_9PEZI|nr:hypothetical protein F5X68DRAFT_277689 [Plectosphaerella plurivora]
MASSSAQRGEYTKANKLSDLLIMQAFLFTKTRYIKYAKAMDKVASMAAMSGSITCPGNLSVYMFFKFDGPLPRELIAEVQNGFLERVDLEPPRIDEIALAHKVLCTETDPNGDKMGKRLPPKDLTAATQLRMKFIIHYSPSS